MTTADLDTAVILVGPMMGQHQRPGGGIGRLAVDRDDALDAQRFEDRQRRAVAVGDDLGDPVVIAQIDEKDTAVIALVVHPARQTDGFANLFLGQGTAVVGTIGVHLKSFHFREYGARGAGRALS